MAVTDENAVSFTQRDVDLFAKLSHDLNPLHRDADYARRTPFGECVVYGILGALAASRKLFAESPVLLRRVAVTFRRPLFMNTSYQVLTKLDRPGHFEASLVRGDNTKLVVEIDYDLVHEAPWSALYAMPAPAPFSPRSEADVFDPNAPGKSYSGRYVLDWSLMKELKASTGLGFSRIRPLQLASLCWTSYLVGMLAPGRQALFQSLSIDFLRPRSDNEFELTYAAQVQGYTSATSILDLTARLTNAAQEDIATLRVGAANRPGPVEYGIAQLEAAVGRSSALGGKLVLVTGSSRGLGSLIALGACLHGADVVLHGRSQVDLEKVAGRVRELGRDCTTVAGDLQQPETWTALASAVKARKGNLDVFVNNAFGAVNPLAFTELTADVVESQVSRVIQSTVLGLQTLLSLLAPRGTIVNISSEATQKPPREMSYYVMAKAAIEGLFVALVPEYPELTFLTVRPPRLHTDMTNGIMAALRGRDPAGVVAAILRAVESTRDGGGHLIDIS